MITRKTLSRRTMLRGAGTAIALPFFDAMAPALSAATGDIPRRALGKTGVDVSILCFGGAHWGRMEDDAEAIRVLHEAIDAGVTFFDNAWEYNGGRSEELMGRALQGRRQQVILMTKVCSHGRDKKVALQQLDDSLRRLKTDYLDLWQIHDGREACTADAAEIGDREHAAGHFLARELPVARLPGQCGQLHRDLDQRLSIGVPDDGNQKPGRRIDGDADIDVRHEAAADRLAVDLASAALTLVDTAWGTLLASCAALAAYWITSKFA